MDFVINFSPSTDWKKNSYNAILVMVDSFKDFVYYKIIKIIISVTSLAGRHDQYGSKVLQPSQINEYFA